MIPFPKRREPPLQPRKGDVEGASNLFRARLDRIIDMEHELVRLAGEIDSRHQVTHCRSGLSRRCPAGRRPSADDRGHHGAA